MDKIKLELSDWLKNAGVLGLYKILKKYSFNDSEIVVNKNYIEFDKSLLDNFEKKYFGYLIDEYLEFTSWYYIISFEDKADRMLNEKISEKDINILNDYIENVKKRLTSASYKSSYEIITRKDLDLAQEEKNLKKLKLKKNQGLDEVSKDVEEQVKNIKKIIEYLKVKEVKEIIAAKNVIYDLVQAFWKDVSFLNKNNNKDNMYKQFEEYFLSPVKDYMDQDLIKAKYSCFTCDNKITKLSKPNAYDITWINNMGVDIARKTSHFWNLYSDVYVCPICNLIYSCVPAGFSFLKGKGLFINNNQSMKALISSNKIVLSKDKTMEELEQESYINILNSFEQKNVNEFKREIENIQIVKIDTSNSNRPYSFSVLSKEKLNIISKNKKILSSLIRNRVKVTDKYYLNLYSEVIKRLYDGKNLFDLIGYLISLNLGGGFRNITSIYLIIKLNNEIMKGEHKVYSKDIEKFKQCGVKLREAYKNSENKLPGISYRLLNALKTKDQARFMDTLINAYMYKKELIPQDFAVVLQDTYKFQNVGYAFLIGLQGNVNNALNDKEKIKEGGQHE